MGWFDNDKQKERGDVPARPEPRREDPAPPAEPRESRPAAAPGSTLGERVHVNGTIVSHEDLTVVGKVEGTIRAAETLRVAEGADVDAVIQGRRVLVQGSVTGDIHGTETVVLGPTASVTGNIRTPSLEIHDGGYFKGEVDMESARKAAAEEAERERRARAAKETEEKRREESESRAKAGGDEDSGGSSSDAPDPADDSDSAADDESETARTATAGEPESGREAPTHGTTGPPEAARST